MFDADPQRLTAALLMLAGCGGTAASTQGTDDGATSLEGSMSATSSGTTVGDEESGSGEPTGEPPTICPPAEPLSTTDGLVHRGRGEGDTFIEILDLQSRGDLVYSCTATQGVTIWDGAAPELPLLVQNVGPAPLAHPQFPRCQHLEFDPSSDLAVISNRGDEIQPDPWLYLYDLADPSAPQALRGWTGSASIEGVAMSHPRIYAAAHTRGVLVFEDQGGDALVLVDELADEASDAWQPLLAGDVLYVADGASGLRIYDTSGGISGDTLTQLASLDLPGSSKDLVLDGDTLYLAASSSLLAVDVSDPSSPVLTTERDVDGTAIALTRTDEGILYTAEWDEVRAYDTSDPALPRVWSEAVPTGDDFSRVLTIASASDPPRVFAGEWTGMHVYDAQAGPTGPDIIGTPTSVQFGRVEPGDSADRVFVLRNTGDLPLQVTGVQSTRAAVTVNESCFDVPPGGAYAIEARFQPEDDAIAFGTLTLTTNDPDEAEYELRYAGNASGADVGDPMPDFVLQDLDGNTWSNEDLEGRVVLLAYFATF